MLGYNNISWSIFFLFLSIFIGEQTWHSKSDQIFMFISKANMQTECRLHIYSYCMCLTTIWDARAKMYGHENDAEPESDFFDR